MRLFSYLLTPVITRTLADSALLYVSTCIIYICVIPGLELEYIDSKFVESRDPSGQHSFHVCELTRRV